MNLRRSTPKLVEISDFHHMDRVAYIPYHAENNINHPDTQWGYVSSTNDKFIFVKFDRYLQDSEWNDVTSHACSIDTLKNFGQTEMESPISNDNS